MSQYAHHNPNESVPIRHQSSDPETNRPAHQLLDYKMIADNSALNDILLATFCSQSQRYTLQRS